MEWSPWTNGASLVWTNRNDEPSSHSMKPYKELGATQNKKKGIGYQQKELWECKQRDQHKSNRIPCNYHFTIELGRKRDGAPARGLLRGAWSCWNRPGWRWWARRRRAPPCAAPSTRRRSSLPNRPNWTRNVPFHIKISRKFTHFHDTGVFVALVTFKLTD